MKTCPKCGKELKDTANFCGFCAYKFSKKICPQCSGELNEAANFCRYCGYKFSAPPSAPAPAPAPAAAAASAAPVSDQDISLLGSFIHWNILPGQLAVKIDESDIESYGKAVKGVSIQEGVKALLFVNGRIVAELGSGNYRFNAWQSEAEQDNKQGIVRRFVGAVCNILPQSWREKAERAGLIDPKTPPFGLLLIRATEFPLIYDFADVPTATVSCEIGVHLLCRIANINEFYNNMLLDRKFVGLESVAEKLDTVMRAQIGFAFRSVAPERIAESPDIQNQLLPRLQEAVAGIYPYIQLSKIIRVSANNADLESLRQMSEQMYVSEMKLTELVRRNEFLTRMQAAKNDQELAELKQGNAHELDMARAEAENEAAKEKIYEQMQLTADERAKFDLMLAAQAKLREAKTEDETAAALAELKKSGMLRDNEIEDLRHQLEHKNQLRDLNDAQVLAMATMQNQMALDQQKLEWETQIGTRRLQNQIEQQRMKDAYGDERRNADAAFEDSRRRANIDIERQEQDARLDALRQAMAIRNEREEAAHRRETESQLLAQQAEKARLDAANEEKRIYAGMSFEQIMAANPNISEAAARALEKKFAAQEASALNDRTAQMATEQSDKMMAFMQQQMAMMRDISMAGINAGASNQQALLNAKQAELDRTRADASANSDRFVDGMKTTISAVGNMGHPAMGTPVPNGQVFVPVPGAQAVVPAPVPGAPAAAKSPAAGRVCPQCHAPVEDGQIICENCGATL